MKNKILKRLKSRRGESLVECLLAILVILLVVLFLTTAIVTAARVNAANRKADTAFAAGNGNPAAGKVTVTVSGSSLELDVTYYEDNDYNYYYAKGGN